MANQRNLEKKLKKENKTIKKAMPDSHRSIDTYNSAPSAYAHAMIDEMIRRLENDRVRYGPRGEYH